MSGLIEYGWVVVAAPCVVAVVIAAVGGWLGRALPAVASLGPATLVGVGAVYLAYARPGSEPSGSVAWLASQVPEGLSVGWRLDPLAAVMLLTVGVVSALVVVFSAAYMAHQPGLPRYYAAISLFTGSMAGLVVADSLLGIFMAWEVMGACSYLLIGFWFTRPRAARAAMKAFLVTRVGDVGMLTALALLWAELGTLDLDAVFAAAPDMAPPVATAAGLLLLAGAIGKSAQFPLHIWLPDAMEGPTPVSALIHAATMVAAGVFLITRTWPLFSASEVAMTVTMAVGGITAIGAALSALVQTDLKRVLAYSTVSQLGFMFCALGAGAWAAATFHLVTHAAFKALLFLGAGSVTHACASRDLREMGGLLRSMPVTGVTWIVGAAALAGVPPLAGFFSKDKVIHELASVSTLWTGVLFAAAFVTALYASRTTRLLLFGPYRGSATPHEGPLSMWVPLGVLGCLAAGAGALGPWLVETIGGHASALDVGIAVIATAVAAAGITAGWFVAGRERAAMGEEPVAETGRERVRRFVAGG
ncbi:MAG TPA: NADH-quinone oxidoreductase subunit L, partial [Coriobacteriia bacterium]|nr:NADH-quinone oxidoreductase subunit L [Coriobacteriia bacterium]